MVYRILIVLAMLNTFGYAQQCQSYACAPASMQMNRNQCIRTDQLGIEKHMYIRTCQPGYKCNMDNLLNGSCQLQPSSFPNRQLEETQWHPVELDYNEFQVPNANCYQTSDCNKFQFCNSTTYKCQNLKTPGQYCRHDSDCVLYAGCDIQNLAGASGLCKEYLSSTAGQIVKHCSVGVDKAKGNMNVNLYLHDMKHVYISWFCQSGHCAQKDHIAVCIDPLTTFNGSQSACNSASDYCVAATDFSQYTECACGKNPSGTSYCNEFFGDPLGRKFISNGRKWFDIYKKIKPYYQCTRDKLFTRDCLEKSKRVSEKWLDEWELTYEHFSKSHLIKNNDECYKHLVISDPGHPLHKYYNIKKKYEIRRCPKFECYEGEDKYWDEDVCISPTWTNSFESPSYKVKECGPEHKLKKDICKIPQNITEEWGIIMTPWNITCSETHAYLPPTVPKHYPGHECEHSSECLMGDCYDDNCLGLWEDTECNHKLNYQCDVGLFCKNITDNLTWKQTCRPLLKEGKLGCLKHTDCEYGYGCDKAPFSSRQGHCVKLFSLKNNDPVNYCTVERRENWLCESGQCMPNNTDIDGDGYCIAAYKSPESRRVCHSDADCSAHSKTNNDTYYKKDSCLCGTRSDGNATCEEYLGDGSGQSYLSAFKDLLSLDIKKCQVDTTLPQSQWFGGFEADHGAMKDCYIRLDFGKWNHFLRKYNEYTKYHILQTYDQTCVEKTVLQSFEAELQDLSASQLVTSWLVLFLTAFLIL